VHGSAIMTTPLRTASELNACTGKIIKGAIEVHRVVGPGLFEKAYVSCLTYELRRAGLQVERAVELKLVYKDFEVPGVYYPDLLVEKSVIVEVKAVEVIAPIHQRQVSTYLRLADVRIGLLLNFGAITMTAGIHRVANDFPDDE
jgi:GxxExxY protein